MGFSAPTTSAAALAALGTVSIVSLAIAIGVALGVALGGNLVRDRHVLARELRRR